MTSNGTERPTRRPPIGTIIAGVVLIGLGILFLLERTMSFEVDWSWIWPLAPIVVGVVFLIQSRGRAWWAWFPLIVGVVFLLKNFIPGLDFSALWPVALIAIGVALVFGMFNGRGEGGESIDEHRRERLDRREERLAQRRGVADPAMAEPAPAAAPAAPAAETGVAQDGRLENPNDPGFAAGGSRPVA